MWAAWVRCEGGGGGGGAGLRCPGSVEAGRWRWLAEGAAEAVGGALGSLGGLMGSDLILTGGDADGGDEEVLTVS